MNAADDAARALEQCRARERAARADVARLEERLACAERVAAELAATQHELEVARGRIEILEAEEHELRRVNRELDATATHFRELNDALMTSASWRLTRPLRSFKR